MTPDTLHHQAALLVQSGVVEHVIGSMQEQYFNQWLATSLDEVDRREELKRLSILAADFRAVLNNLGTIPPGPLGANPGVTIPPEED